MAAERKISDEELVRLRHLAEDGWSYDDLARAFDVTPQHVGRLVRGEQRPVIAGLDAEALREGGVTAAVGAFLENAELTLADEVLAATARALAAKLDACAGSDTASAAQAVPRIAAELVDVLDRLQAAAPREPDCIDDIRQRRDARRLAAAAYTGGGAYQ